MHCRSSRSATLRASATGTLRERRFVGETKHFAGALGVPTLGLFGPKDPAVFSAAGAHVRTVRTGVRCSPCALRFCPDPICMTGLGVEQVEREALALLEDAA